MILQALAGHLLLVPCISGCSISVLLSGSAGAFEVRVGYGHQDIEERRGFESNPYCGNGPGLTLDDTMELTCQRVRVGRYISIHVIDPTVFRQLKLCEVEVIVDEE